MGKAKVKGDSTELACILAFRLKGWKVSIPYGEDSKYDLILDTGEKLLRVQCKFAHLSSDGSNISITCLSNNKKYLPGSIDCYATVHKGKCYLIPYVNQKVISLRLTPPKNNQKEFIRFAHDYFIGSIIQG